MDHPNTKDEPPSIAVTRRDDCSARTSLLHWRLRTAGSKLNRPKRFSFPEGEWSLPLVIPQQVKLPPSITVSMRQISGIWIHDITTAQHIDDNQKLPGRACRRKQIYYIAGGSWQSPPGPHHWKSVTEWALVLPDTTVGLISAPLAPAHPAPRAFDKLLELYQQLMAGHTEATAKDDNDEPERIIWAGDSSGANQVLCVTVECLSRHPELRAPDAIMAICPSTDLTRANPAIKVVEKKDPLLSYDAVVESAAVWAGEWDRADARVSPLFADLARLRARNIAVHGVTAGYDVLGPDGVLFRERLADLGIRGRWLEWGRQMHNFPLTWTYAIREAREAFVWITAVLRDV